MACSKSAWIPLHDRLLLEGRRRHCRWPRIGQTVRQIISQLADDSRIAAPAVRIDQFHRRQLRQTHAMTDDPQWRSDERTGEDGDPHSLHRRRLEAFKARADETEMPGPPVILQRRDGEVSRLPILHGILGNRNKLFEQGASTHSSDERARLNPPVQTASLATFGGGVLTDLLAGLAANSIGLAKSFFRTREFRRDGLSYPLQAHSICPDEVFRFKYERPL